MSTIQQRLADLRKVMLQEGISAYIIPSSDAHLSEYTPEHWKGRTWISGFTGSAGTVVVTLERAALWTDGRYFLQAATELEGSTIELMKMGLLDTPSIETFLGEVLPSGSVVAADGACLPYADAVDIAGKLSVYGISFRLDTDLFTKVWTDRPEVPRHEIFSQPSEYSGQTAADRIALVNARLKSKGANATIITMLCELAWVFNIRGYDVEYNPVAVGFGFISDKQNILFMDSAKVPSEVSEELARNGVEVRPYEAIDSFIAGLGADVRLYIDEKRITYRLYSAIPAHCAKIQGVSILTMLKAVKTPVELACLRKAMQRDGVSLTRFFKWLEAYIQAGNTISEYELGLKLTEFRAQGDKFYGDSFGTIAGFQDHGAIIHYKAMPETSNIIKAEGTLLLDSGGQYKDGTTDITRCIALGVPSEQFKRDYTLVLKGHIAIATAVYPEGTRGSQLDILARKALWDNGLNYAHGTGHGVGFFLNVHEGPQNIRTEINPTTLEVGMITSNEPGLYRSGEYGIRIENLIVTEERETTPFGRFLGFETVTLCYFDNRLVDKTLLTEAELAWYNAYQARVYEELSPSLNEEEKAWLKNKTTAL